MRIFAHFYFDVIASLTPNLIIFYKLFSFITLVPLSIPVVSKDIATVFKANAAAKRAGICAAYVYFKAQKPFLILLYKTMAIVESHGFKNAKGRRVHVEHSKDLENLLNQLLNSYGNKIFKDNAKNAIYW